MTLRTRYSQVISQIKQAQLEFNRPTASIQLLAVSKTWPASRLRELAELGQTDFGENYLQEALEKIEQLKALKLIWHFIGPIQSNKTRAIAENFDWVHSVDRVKIAQRLSAQRSENKPDLNICIQINIDNEGTKSGISENELMQLAHEVEALPKLKLRGIMIIPAKTSRIADQRASFQHAKQLFEQLAKTFPDIDTLSMGMSADMATAIAEGSTLVRIGSALFGQRATPNKTGQVN